MMRMFLIFVFHIHAASTVFTNSQATHAERVMVFDERIVRIQESSKEHLVLFDRHAAFYTIPKNIKGLKQFLEESRKSGAIVKAKINPQTAEILEIRSK